MHSQNQKTNPVYGIGGGATCAPLAAAASLSAFAREAPQGMTPGGKRVTAAGGGVGSAV